MCEFCVKRADVFQPEFLRDKKGDLFWGVPLNNCRRKRTIIKKKENIKVYVHNLWLVIISSKRQGRHFFSRKEVRNNNNKTHQTAITFKKQQDN